MALRIAIVAVLLALAGAPAAGAVPFGTDLSLPANANVDCTVLPLPPPGFNPGFTVVPSGATTCTWMAAGTALNPQANTFVAPVAGVVTTVSVRAGRVTGPMQVVVLRSVRDFFSTQDPICCTEVARSQVFTPAPNGITTIATALPVRKDVVPDPINRTVVFDTLGLSVLAPGVPVPLFDTGSHDPANLANPSAIAFFPAIAPNTERFGFSGAGVGGFQVLMAADVTPTPVTDPAPAGNVTAPVALVGRRLAVNNGAVRLPIRCSLVTGACTGTVRLANGAQAAATIAAVKTYGKGKVRIPAGKQGRVKVKLTKAGRKLLKGRRSAKVWVNAVIGGTKVKSKRYTLKR